MSARRRAPGSSGLRAAGRCVRARQDADAIVAFTKSLEAAPDNVKAKFQRGQVYVRMKDRAHAQGDLEELLRAAGASLEFTRQQAHRMLMDLAAKR